MESCSPLAVPPGAQKAWQPAFCETGGGKLTGAGFSCKAEGGHAALACWNLLFAGRAEQNAVCPFRSSFLTDANLSLLRWQGPSIWAAATADLRRPQRVEGYAIASNSLD